MVRGALDKVRGETSKVAGIGEAKMHLTPIESIPPSLLSGEVELISLGGVNPE